VFRGDGCYHLPMTKVVIYSKPDCHLCEEAKVVIQSAGCSARFTLEEVNIESDPELKRRYRYDIPVITIDGVEAFRHRVSLEEFRAAIEGVGSSR
jgi:glutaredoxin